MQIPNEWLDRIRSLKGEGRSDDLKKLALQCLRLTIPLLDDKTKIEHIIRISDSFNELRKSHSAGVDADELDNLLASKGLMTEAELRAAHMEYSIFIRLATDLRMASEFAMVASAQLAAYLDAQMARSLGDDEAYRAVAKKFGPFFKAGTKSQSLLHVKYPEAAETLTALLRGRESSKTLDRLSVFRSFTIHNSFRHVARQTDEGAETPDHTGPAYKVRKLGETLGIQLTCLATGPGRSRTELTPAGHALADWIGCRPDLFF